jgi:hypothetical protein
MAGTLHKHYHKTLLVNRQRGFGRYAFADCMPEQRLGDYQCYRHKLADEILHCKGEGDMPQKHIESRRAHRPACFLSSVLVGNAIQSWRSSLSPFSILSEHLRVAVS